AVPESESDYGPWMIAQPRNRRRNSRVNTNQKGDDLNGEKLLGSRFNPLTGMEEVVELADGNSNIAANNQRDNGKDSRGNNVGGGPGPQGKVWIKKPKNIVAEPQALNSNAAMQPIVVRDSQLVEKYKMALEKAAAAWKEGVAGTSSAADTTMAVDDVVLGSAKQVIE
ncbi:hypothetical protein CCACVL1_02927, partial [Corchorus capsularis]